MKEKIKKEKVDKEKVNWYYTKTLMDFYGTSDTKELEKLVKKNVVKISIVQYFDITDNKDRMLWQTKVSGFVL